MPFTTWIRDLFGIRKDVIDAKKAKLEITKLEDEEGERRGLIELATLDDVKKYDPKTRSLIEKITETLIGISVIIILLLTAVPRLLWEHLKAVARFLWRILSW